MCYNIVKMYKTVKEIPLSLIGVIFYCTSLIECKMHLLSITIHNIHQGIIFFLKKICFFS